MNSENTNPGSSQAAVAVMTEQRSASEMVVEALGKFVREQAKVPAEPEHADHLAPRQYVALILFCCNVIVLYLTLSSLFTMMVKSPLWHLLAQVVPLAVGSGFIVARAKHLQNLLLGLALKKRFIWLMIAFLVLLGSAGYTQIPQFEIPVEVSANPAQFCAEEVDNVEDVISAVQTTQPMSNEHCAGGRPQSGGERHLRHLKLGKRYMVTVKQPDSSPDRFYLSGTAVFRRALGINPDSLRLRTVTLNIDVKAKSRTAGSGNQSRTITIHRDDSTDVVYITEGCTIEKDTRVITCTLPTTGLFPLELMPGNYHFGLDGQCKISQSQPIALNKDEQVTLSCP